MKKTTAEIRKLINEIDEEYKKDPQKAEKEEQYRRKYAALTEKDLDKQFTI